MAAEGEEEEAQQRRLGEVKARKLWKKRDSESKRYNQMAGEEKARSCRRREMLRETDTGSWQLRRRQGFCRIIQMLKGTSTSK
jgi:hypothetical protein